MTTSSSSLPGPTLHVVDLDGLAITGVLSVPRYRIPRRSGAFHRALVVAYASAARLRAQDHALLLHLDASLDGHILTVAAPCPWWFGERGPVRLTPTECLMRYERVVVGTGTAKFAPFVSALRAVGLPVTVVHRPGLVAPALAQAAAALVSLPRVDRRRAAASASAYVARHIAELPRP